MTVLDRVPVEQISARAREIRAAPLLLTLFAALFYAIGWTAGRVFLAVVWCAVAIRVGWQAGAARGGPARAG